MVPHPSTVASGIFPLAQPIEFQERVIKARIAFNTRLLVAAYTTLVLLVSGMARLLLSEPTGSYWVLFAVNSVGVVFYLGICIVLYSQIKAFFDDMEKLT